MFDFWRFKEVSSFKVGSCLIGDYLLFLFGICIWFLILRWSQHARFEAKSGSKAQSRAGCLKVASLVFCCHSRLFHVLLHYMVGVCHAQRWICRVNLPVQLLSKLMCFYNHGISPLGSWMIVWFQYLSIFAIKATCIRHVSDCFLWSKKVRFGFMLSLSLSVMALENILIRFIRYYGFCYLYLKDMHAKRPCIIFTTHTIDSICQMVTSFSNV